MKKKFYTKFDLPERHERILDQHDEVDRLTYLDTFTQIKMFMQAGKNITMNAKDGIYQSFEEAEKDSSAFSTPVYKDDPVIVAAKLKAFSESQNHVLDQLSDGSVNEQSEKSMNDGSAKDNVESSEVNPHEGPASV